MRENKNAISKVKSVAYSFLTVISQKFFENTATKNISNSKISYLETSICGEVAAAETGWQDRWVRA